MTQVYLHIGMPKTGTSAIQYFLLQNRQKLNEMGYFYPKHTVDKNLVSGGHAHFLRTDEMRQKFTLDLPKSSQRQKIIISWEGLFRYPEEMTRIFPQVNKVIIYLRRQDLRIESAYNQKIKRKSATCSIEDFPLLAKLYSQEGQIKNSNFLKKNFNKNRYLAIVDKWSEMFGHENISINTFEGSYLKRGTFLSDFLKQLDITATDGFKLPEPRINRSYIRDALEFKRLVNHFPSIEASLDVPLQKYSDSFDTDPWPYAILSNSQRHLLMKKFVNDNRALAQKYLGRDKLFLDQVPSLSREWQPYPGLSKEAIMDIGLFLKKSFPNEFSALKEEIASHLKTNTELTKTIKPLELLLTLGTNFSKVRSLIVRQKKYLKEKLKKSPQISRLFHRM